MERQALDSISAYFRFVATNQQKNKLLHHQASAYMVFAVYVANITSLLGKSLLVVSVNETHPREGA